MALGNESLIRHDGSEAEQRGECEEGTDSGG